ncbi:MAG: hypothetical protein IB618_01485 [Candidatus Pacearchaeota archaeon]|nr:MAG: hypothetical protein IB618_01485 [Candidatus Pacearchaeota archaeon]
MTEEKKEGSRTTEEIIESVNPKYEKPIWEHGLVYDSPAEQLEPVYFWILEFMKELGFDVEKIVDNFAASPGSGYFAEIGQRAKIMQEEGMKIMQTIGVMLKSLVNLFYDLKEFEIRLKQYDLAKSKDEKKRESGILGLKQIWMDKVDIQRGNTSIKGLASQFMYATVIDAFMIAKNPEEVDKMDLNDRVKRVLKPRVAEFLAWRDRSEAELRKRFEVERAWVKSQVDSLKLYTRWAKPYLKAAQELMMKEKTREPSLVKAFNIILLELSIIGKNKINVQKEADLGNLPKKFRNLKLKRDYYACVFVDFVFRGTPTRTPQGHYVFGGRAEVNFKAYALNEDELKVLDKELDKEDFKDALSLVETVTEQSLSQVIEDLEHFTEKKEKEEKKKKEKEKKELEIGKIKKDNFEESIIRKFAERTASALCYKIYDVYKKSHGMASFAEPEWEIPGRWNVPK